MDRVGNACRKTNMLSVCSPAKTSVKAAEEQMIHCSCDNVDVLDASLDGKNFHSTQMMVRQQCPTP